MELQIELMIVLLALQYMILYSTHEVAHLFTFKFFGIRAKIVNPKHINLEVVAENYEYPIWKHLLVLQAGLLVNLIVVLFFYLVLNSNVSLKSFFLVGGLLLSILFYLKDFVNTLETLSCFFKGKTLFDEIKKIVDKEDLNRNKKLFYK